MEINDTLNHFDKREFNTVVIIYGFAEEKSSKVVRLIWLSWLMVNFGGFKRISLLIAKAC